MAFDVTRRQLLRALGIGAAATVAPEAFAKAAEFAETNIAEKIVGDTAVIEVERWEPFSVPVSKDLAALADSGLGAYDPIYYANEAFNLLEKNLLASAKKTNRRERRVRDRRLKLVRR